MPSSRGLQPLHAKIISNNKRLLFIYLLLNLLPTSTLKLARHVLFYDPVSLTSPVINPLANAHSLHSGWHVDQAILVEEDRVVCIRFGHDHDEECMAMDETLYGVSEKVQNFAVLYLGQYLSLILYLREDLMICSRHHGSS